MKYRRDIDGLRAVAVLPVVLFHFGISAIPGGFTGVDIFFVISGYLITGSLLDDLERGQFSIVSFYWRRARRILPALIFVTLLTCIAALFILLPSDLHEFSLSVIAASTFWSNIYFWKRQITSRSMPSSDRCCTRGRFRSRNSTISLPRS